MLITFIAGLLPVIGNLISNTIIVSLSLTHGLIVSISSLLWLVTIHKLEYFLNAQIDSLLLLFHLSTLLEKVSDDNDSVHPD